MSTPEYVKRADSSFKRVMVVSVVLLVIVAVVFILGSQGGGGIEETADAWLQHVRGGESAEAYEMLAADYRSAVDAGRFHTEVVEDSLLGGNTGLSAGTIRTGADGKTLSARVGTDSGDAAIEFRFVIETGWFAKRFAIAEVTLDGEQVLPASVAP